MPGRPRPAGARGDVDDAPIALLDHLRQHRLGGEHHALQVGGDDLIEQFAGVLQKRRAARQAGGVDQDVDLAEAFVRGGDDAVDLLLVGGVGLHGERLAAQRLDLGGNLARVIRVDVGGDDDGALFGRHQARGAADTAASAGDHHHAPFEQHGKTSWKAAGSPSRGESTTRAAEVSGGGLRGT